MSQQLSQDTISFYINGKKHEIKNPNPTQTLLQYLRSNGYTGTKLTCGEGGCGACTVMVSHFDHTQQTVIHRAVNACLAPLCSVDGMAVVTVEGLGSTKTILHPIQERLAMSNSSQCGFCTPGFVMSLYTLLRNNPNATEKEIEEAFDGNLCRCTGYRPILEGAKSFANQKKTTSICPGTGLPCDCQKEVVNNCNKYDENKVEKHWLFPSELKNRKPRELVIKGSNIAWYRPTSLKSLLEIKKQFPKCKIVVGNTEAGLEMKFKYFDPMFTYPVLVSPTQVPELNEIKAQEDGIVIGSAVTLANIQQFVKNLMPNVKDYQQRGLKAILKQLRYFSGTQIRNVSSIGGNIVTGSPISDLNPVWAALGAHANVIATDGTMRKKLMKEFFLNYRVVDLKDNELLYSIFVPYCKELEFARAYKQAKRREDDIAIVTACLKMSFKKTDNEKNPYIVEDCCFAYGGMYKTLLCAPKVQEYLKGKPFNDETFEHAATLLMQQFKLPEDVPGGMPHYRMSLTLSFFYKFFLSIKHDLYKDIPEELKSAIEEPERPVSKGIQTWTKKITGTSVGDARAHLSAKLQATGEAIYTDDIQKQRNEKYGAFVLTTIPRGRITKVDASAALKMEGVHAFITAKDVPGSNKIGAIEHDEELFVTKEVYCVGQVIGLIVADTDEQAKAASRAVVVEYEKLEPILTIQDAIKAKSFLGDYHQISKGDVEKAFTTCDHIVSGDLYIGGQEHFYLEPQVSLVCPGEHQEMMIYVSSQNLTETQRLVAEVLGVDSNKVVAKAKRIGGGFGGKESRNVFITCACAVAAVKLNCPIRMSLDRDMDMAITGQRHPFYAQYKVGFNKDGKIIAFDTKLYSNAGYSLDLSQSVMDRALFHIDNCYNIPNVRVVGRCCKTNLPTNTAFRGFGGPQGMMVTETMIDHVAKTLNISPEKLRQLNLYKQGDITHFGQVLDQGDRIEKLWNAVKKCADYENRLAQVQQFNKSNKYRKRGISVIPTKFGIAFTAVHLNQGGALVHIYTDGSVLISHGGIEMGQGVHTKVAAVAATSLGVPLEKVFISETSTDKVPNTSPTAASCGSDLYGGAVYDACRQLNERLEPYRKKFGEKASFADIVKAAYMDRVNLSAQGFYKTPDIGYEFEEKGMGKGRPFGYFTFGAACSEVEIDTLTGDFRVIRSDIVMDVGDSLNPYIDIGQIEGAFIQGLGLFMIEEMVWGDDKNRFTWIKPGHLKSKGPGMYKIPSIGDVPLDFRVHLLPNAPNAFAIMRSKAIGEPPLFLGSTVFYATKQAIYALREENGVKGYFVLDTPGSCERIRMACADKILEKIVNGKHQHYRPYGSY